MSAEPFTLARSATAVTRTAVVSACGRYRYRLTRRWGTGPAVLFAMLNPSTADAAVDDPTIRKCVGFATRWGFAAIDVVNLYAFRATDPNDLVRACRAGEDVVGPDHATHLHAAMAGDPGLRVAAWGAQAARLDAAHARYVASVLDGVGGALCLGRSKDGQPRHPLMLAYATRLVSLEARDG